MSCRLCSSLVLHLKYKRIQRCMLLLVVLLASYYIWSHSAGRVNNRDQQSPQVIFDWKNTPYRNLKNSHCTLKENGHWDCPDIRTQGQNEIRQVQLVAMRMLLIFDALCKKHGLRYWVKRGTLLGAVRHGGFIPWDSDLDIEMPMEDYIEFVHKASKEFPTGMILQHHEGERKALQLLRRQTADLNSKATKKQLEEFYFSIINPWNPRLRDKKSCYKYCLQVQCPWIDGILIDLYPVLLRNGRYFDFHFDRPSNFNKLWRFVFGYDGFKPFPLKSMKFEGFEVPVQSDWKKFLTTTYGTSYMEIPPVEKRRLSDGYQIPDAIHACSELDTSGNVKRKSAEQ